MSALLSALRQAEKQGEDICRKENATKLFYEYYHCAYPTNINLLRGFLQSFDKSIKTESQSKHMQAMIHFLDVLESNENVFVYGMLCNAWTKFINELYNLQ